MTTLPNLSLVLPVRGAPGSGLWADAIDAALSLIDAHDHTSGKGLRITSAALNINADVSFGTSWAPINLNRLTFASIAALASNNKSLFVSDGTGGLVSGELYWRSNAGSNVRVTSGAALNVAAFTGGIGGDYAAVGAAVAFDDAGDRYTFKQQAPGNWARLASGDVRLFETGTTDSVFVGLAAPAALAGSYTITMPLAAPGSTQLVQMDSAGVLTASNTVGNTLTIPATVAGASNFTGAITMASTLGVTGLITATAGATAAVNQSFTVSGTGRYKHPSQELGIHIAAFQVDGASTYVTFNQIGYITGFGGACTVQAWVPLPVGKRILTYRQFYNVNSTGVAITPKLRRMTIGDGTKNDVAAGSADNTGAAVESQNLTGINHTVLAGEGYFIEVSVSNASHQVFGASISYDDP